MNYAQISLRNLSRQKRRSALLVVAIAFGVLIVTVIDGFAGSFVDNTSENFSQLMGGHVYVRGEEMDDAGKVVKVIRDDAAVKGAIEAAGIGYRNLTEASSFQASMSFEGRSISTQVLGLDFQDPKSLAKERIVLRSGSFADIDYPRSIVLSEQAASTLRVKVGDTILAKLSTLKGQANVGEFRLVAICVDPSFIGAARSYANLKYVNELLALESGDYLSMGIMLPDIRDSDRAAEALKAAMRAEGLQFKPPKDAAADEDPMQRIRDIGIKKDEPRWEGTRYQVTSIYEELAQVKEIVDVLNQVSMAFLVILFLIVMVGISNTFKMIMFERIREIGTMRAVGMQRGSVRGLFVLEAVFLALIGAAAGLALGGLVMLGLSQIDLGVDSPVFFILKNGHLSFAVQPLQVAISVAIVTILTFLAALGPANKAARLDPAVALRTQK